MLDSIFQNLLLPVVKNQIWVQIIFTHKGLIGGEIQTAQSVANFLRNMIQTHVWQVLIAAHVHMTFFKFIWKKKLLFFKTQINKK